MRTEGDGALGLPELGLRDEKEESGKEVRKECFQQRPEPKSKEKLNML